MFEELTIAEIFNLMKQNFNQIDEQTNRFIAILNLPYCKIDIRLGVATAINGADPREKASLAINANVLILFIKNLKLSLTSDFEKLQANKFIELLEAPYCLIDIRQGDVNAVNGLDNKKKSSLRLEASVLILFIENLKSRLRAEFEIKKANYIASQTI